MASSNFESMPNGENMAEIGKNIPQPGQKWVFDGIPGYLKIIYVNKTSETVLVEIYDENDAIKQIDGEDVEAQNISLDELMSQAHIAEPPAAAPAPANAAARPEAPAAAPQRPEVIPDPVGGVQRYSIVNFDRMPERLRALNIPKEFHIVGKVWSGPKDILHLKNINDSNHIVDIARADWNELYPALKK